MSGRFETMQLPGARDEVAPDGSDVRVLVQLARGGMAHFELGARRVSRGVAHRSVDEIWYILRGRGQMWRRQEHWQEVIPLRPGTCVSIPAGTHFQFRSTSGGPLTAVGVTMPPWPGEDEAYEVRGAWARRSLRAGMLTHTQRPAAGSTCLSADQVSLAGCGAGGGMPTVR